MLAADAYRWLAFRFAWAAQLKHMTEAATMRSFLIGLGVLVVLGAVVWKVTGGFPDWYRTGCIVFLVLSGWRALERRRVKS